MPHRSGSKPWQWMRRYRIWRANRKVVVYPENYVEPELREEKSELFEEVEGALPDDRPTDPGRE